VTDGRMFLDCRRCKKKNATSSKGYTLCKAFITAYNISQNNIDEMADYRGAFVASAMTTELEVNYVLNSWDDFEFYCLDCFDHITDKPKEKT
jgi:hypothetical protein